MVNNDLEDSHGRDSWRYRSEILHLEKGMG